MKIFQASCGRGHCGLLTDIAMLQKKKGTVIFSNGNPEREWGQGKHKSRAMDRKR